MTQTLPLVVTGLTKRFGEVRALSDVSFSVRPGEILGYLGPNSAGKTTTLRIVLGLVWASSGDVKVFGLSPADPASRASIGFLPGDLRLYGDLTGEQLLDYFARFRPRSRPGLRAELIERLALDAPVLQRRVKSLSHGTRQKLGLIVAMQHDPALLILDEPSNGLDPLIQHSFRQLISERAALGRSILFSSHMLNEVQAVCSRVAILREGHLVALETVDALRANMVRRLTVRFAGDIPNRLLTAPNVAKSEVDGAELLLWIRGDLNALIRALADAQVNDLVFPEAQLEDIFLSYYQQDPAAHG